MHVDVNVADHHSSMKSGNIKPRRSVYNLRSNESRMPQSKQGIGLGGLEPQDDEDLYEENSSENEITPTKKKKAGTIKLQPLGFDLPCKNSRTPEKTQAIGWERLEQASAKYENFSKNEYTHTKPKIYYFPENAMDSTIPTRQTIFSKNMCDKWCILIIVILGIAVSTFSYSSNDESDQNFHLSKREKWFNDIDELKKIFPTQSRDLWEELSIGIKDIQFSDPTKPSVFLLLHTGDISTTECLVQKVAYKAGKFLGENSPEPIFIRGKEIKMNSSLIDDYGLFISTYKADIEKRHVMVIYELEDIPAVVAQSFHSLCDVDNPTVKKAAYVFTLKVDRDFENPRPRRVAETVLRELWSKYLKTDIRDPLISRVVNIVSFVEPENNVPCQT